MVEAFDPATPSFEGIILFNQDYKKTVNKLKEKGYELKDLRSTVFSGYFLLELGISFYITPNGLECVAFFEKGYYDDILE